MIELNQKEKYILNYLRINPGKTTSEIIHDLSLKTVNSYAILAKLHKQGIVECRRVQATNGGRGRIPEQ